MSSTTSTSTTDLASEYRFIFDIVLISLLFILLLVVLGLMYSKQKNVPVSQCIEVDPREPHSITITFVPAGIIETAAVNPNVVTSASRTETNVTPGIGMTEMRASDNQTAPIA